jgi:hypothetical protein
MENLFSINEKELKAFVLTEAIKIPYSLYMQYYNIKEVPKEIAVDFAVLKLVVLLSPLF